MPQNTCDILIIGQGLAGSILGYFLEKMGLHVRLIDNQWKQSATRIAAGLVNPISGKRLTLPWKVSELLPFSKQFYQDLEDRLKTRLISPLPTLRLFTNQTEHRIFTKKKKMDAYREFFHSVDKGSIPDGVAYPHGLTLFRESYFLNMPLFLTTMRDYFKKNIHSFQLSVSRVNVYKDRVVVGDIEAKKIIFCTGFGVMTLPWLERLPFRPAKGQTLSLSIPELSPAYIYNFGRWLVPLEKGTFKLGATYEWEDMTLKTSSESRSELIEHLCRHITSSATVINHDVGIRCMVKDLQPFMGFLSSQPLIGVFSGFGSKGVMMAPYFGEKFAQHIVHGAPMDTDVSLSRFGI